MSSAKFPARRQSSNIDRQTFFQCVRSSSWRRKPIVRILAFTQSGAGLQWFREI
jgi:hypothetical protein